MTIAKPIPGHHFHQYDDELLTSLIRSWRDQHDNGEVETDVFKRLLADAYAVLGYRSALEYIKQYEKE
jgi:hypothetical protein